MAVIRTILAGLIAVSVALLPVAIFETISAPSSSIAMSDHADMPCCPTGDRQGDFKSATCMAKCMSLVGAVLPAADIALLHLPRASMPSIGGAVLHGRAIPPPTHPPPV